MIRNSRPSKPATGILLATAAVLSGAAAIVHKKKVEAERTNPPLGKFVEVDGVHLHYIERGAGPALVLLHGNMVPPMIFC